MGHALTENRNGLVVAAALTHATGTAEREAACAMLGDLPGRHAVTLGADKAYDMAEFVAEMRRLGVTPHVAQNKTRRRSAIDPCPRAGKCCVNRPGIGPLAADRGSVWRDRAAIADGRMAL